MDWREKMKRVLDDPATHSWVKDILNQALQKDPVDAYFDIALVAMILKARMDEAVGLNE
jgi:hypothetical protein